MYTPNNPEDTRQVQACKMRAEGQSIREVAKHFGVGYTAIRIWTDPKARETRNSYRQTTEDSAYHRRANLKRHYGITPEEYDAMLTKQNNCCAICKKENTANKSMPVDHCHKTGKVRQILCSNCNTAIGLLQEDPETLRAAIDYIERHTQPN